jgi:hypothetical protein
MENISGENVIILESARKHDIYDTDIIAVLSEPKAIVELRESPEKLLF